MIALRISSQVLVALALSLWLSAAPLLAWQEQSREEEWLALRRAKEARLAPDKRGRIESALLWMQERKIKEKLETPGAGYKGFRPKFGGLSTGSGFAFGFQFDRPRRLSNHLDFSFSGASSFRQYQQYDIKFDFPRLLDNRAFATAYLRYRNMPQEDYFGLGPDSRRQDRTDYLYEDATYELVAGLRPLPWLSVGGGAAWIQINVGPGTDVRFTNTEVLFNDLNTPGLEQQSDFLRSGVFAQVDYRDSAGNPHSGGFYRADFSNYGDRKARQFSFRRFEAELQQYFPFNYGHRVLALRFMTSFDDAKAGHRVPFYLQRALGGSNDLRGFREFRFRDLNQMVFNLEYRWEAWIGLDMALFGDAGKVFGDRNDFNLDDLEADFGIGFRFNTAKGVFWRIDIAHSHEGTRFFIKFNHVF